MSTNSLSNRDSDGRRAIALPRIARRCLAAAVMAALLGQSFACSSNSRQDAPPAGRPVGGVDHRPIILSGDPRSDAAAYNRSERDLAPTKWGVIDDLGPKPAWESVPGKRQKLLTTGAAGTPEATTISPTTRSMATTRRGGDATTLPIQKIDESDLPITIAELPDGKLRIIWVLRSYGGTTVTSKRDGGVSRRDVQLAPADLAPLVAALTPNLGEGGAVVPLPRENTLVITCWRNTL